ncbi:MAG: S-adenosylmethionine:tRNA ribosyltransferase-isomerase [Actinomycetota bacterium]
MTTSAPARASSAGTAFDFELPPELEASVPPEVRGRARDDVRMLVAEADTARLRHAHVRDLPRVLNPGDLIVINTSATTPAALDAATPDGPARLHLSTPLPGGLWTVELRSATGGMWNRDVPGVVSVAGGGRARFHAPFGASARLWVASLDVPNGIDHYLARWGTPIRYEHARAWPLAAYQTTYATEPGSAEMPSAGRALTPRIITDLVARGIGVTPLVLHCGVSSLELDEEPYPERYRVPSETARRVNETRAGGGQVIAIGTTVVRALETVADGTGRVHPGAGWTDIVVDPEGGVRAINGLVTGWHQPRASHLALVEAVAGRDLLHRSYRAAVDGGYLWHEFGDLHLLLP